MEDKRYMSHMNWQGCKCPKKEEKCCQRKVEKCHCQKRKNVTVKRRKMYTKNEQRTVEAVFVTN